MLRSYQKKEHGFHRTGGDEPVTSLAEYVKQGYCQPEFKHGLNNENKVSLYDTHACVAFSISFLAKRMVRFLKGVRVQR